MPASVMAVWIQYDDRPRRKIASAAAEGKGRQVMDADTTETMTGGELELKQSLVGSFVFRWRFYCWDIVLRWW